MTRVDKRRTALKSAAGKCTAGGQGRLRVRPARRLQQHLPDNGFTTSVDIYLDMYTSDRQRPSVRLGRGHQQHDRRIRPRLHLQRRHEAGRRRPVLSAPATTPTGAGDRFDPFDALDDLAERLVHLQARRSRTSAAADRRHERHQCRGHRPEDLDPDHRDDDIGGQHQSAGTATPGSSTTTSRRSRSTTSPGSRTKAKITRRQHRRGCRVQP